MAYVKLGTITQDVVELFVFDDEDKQNGSIYCTKDKDEILRHAVIGKIPFTIENQIYKIRGVAQDMLFKE